MSNNILSYVLRLVLLLAAQVLVVNNIEISGILNPFIYIYFIIVLPVSASRIGILITGFALGLVVDMFQLTLGIHTVAATFLAFCRPFVLEYMAPRDGYEFSRVPGVRQMGYLWFLTYATILTLLHHFMLFFVEMFRLSGFWFTMGKVLGSTVLTVVLLLLIEILFTRNSLSKSSYD